MAAGPRIDVLTIFPELLRPVTEASILGAAIERGLIEVQITDLRDFASGRHRVVDDDPYGGGDGMVLKCEPVVAAIEAVMAKGPTAGETRAGGTRVLAMSPRGRRLDQDVVAELAAASHLVLVCGRYAGFDQRILDETGAEELSIGDYVLSGGEAAAWVVIEAVSRLVPGVLGNPVSAALDSFSGGLLEHPVYTRPPVFRGRAVPEELLRGNHAEILRFRRKQALALTARRRPDLLAAFEQRLDAEASDEGVADRGGAEIGVPGQPDPAEQRAMDREILREVKGEQDSGD